MDAVNNVLVYVNIALSVVLMAASTWYVCLFRNYLTWIKVLYAFVGLYCLVIYLMIMICDPVPSLVDAMLRPGITLILAVMASGALFRVLVERNIL